MGKSDLDIFQQAASEVLETTNSTVSVKTIQEGDFGKTEGTMTILEARNWNELQEAFNSYHVKRFNRVMQQLPDREFTRVFIKIAPFFKQNAAKQPPAGPTTLNQINITVNRSGEKTEEKTITLK
tara:strand:+ start:86 stop:460 length:375 start_codon:yes stop_codon:yes gene_type:complete